MYYYWLKKIKSYKIVPEDAGFLERLRGLLDRKLN